jgi:hypothetical protein
MTDKKTRRAENSGRAKAYKTIIRLETAELNLLKKKAKTARRRAAKKM